MANLDKFKSIENQILKSITNFKRGKIFFPSNFSKFGSSSSVRKALSRLEDKEILIRIAHGIYLYPKILPQLGIIKPTLEEIAEAISKRDKARIIPTGIQAMNKLGLTTQVPLNAVFYTDGSPRTITILNRSIKFKKASPKILAVKSEILLLIFLALGELGMNQFDNTAKTKLESHVKQVDDRTFQHDIKLAPIWISELVKKMKSNERVVCSTEKRS